MDIPNPLAAVAAASNLIWFDTSNAGEMPFSIAMKPTRLRSGTISRRISRRLLISSTVKPVVPVALPPGRARLAINPDPMGSAGLTKTMGTDFVNDSTADNIRCVDRYDQIGLQS